MRCVSALPLRGGSGSILPSVPMFAYGRKRPQASVCSDISRASSTSIPR
jgi:hypothetical protein